MKKLMLVLICMIFVSVFVNASVTLDKTEGTIEVDQGSSATIQLTVTNNNNYDFTNVKFGVESIGNFMDSGDNQITIGFSDNADSTGFSLGVNQSKTIIITATTEDDQYLGELSGAIIATATRPDNGTETARFTLTVDTQADMIDITLDEGNLDDEIYPGDSGSFSIEVENNAGYDLEDVQITVWIVDIEDGDDIDIKSKKFDLDSSDNEEIDFDFDIPYNVDENDYDIKVKVKGQDADDSDNDFEIIKTFSGIVNVEKEEDEEVYLTELNLAFDTLKCGDSFNVGVSAINIGTDDLDEAYLKLMIEGTDIVVKSEEFDLESDDYDDREKDVDFLVKLPSDLDEKTYQIRILAYTEDDDVVGSVYKTITIEECGVVQDDTNDETDSETEDEETDEEDNTVYLPTGWTTKFFSSENGKTIFWFMGNLALLVIIVYFVTVLVRKKSIKK